MKLGGKEGKMEEVSVRDEAGDDEEMDGWREN